MRKHLIFVLASFLLVLSTAAQETYWIRVATARVRSCPQTTCSIVARVRRNAAVQVLETVRGNAVSGNTTWYRIQTVNGREGYVHSSLVTNVALANPSSGGSSGSTNQQNTQPQAAPPVSEPQSQAPASQWTCGGDNYNCGNFSTCGEVTSYFNTCPGDPSRLDGDNDGIPCESLCR